ncbi:hypothetical protein [Caldisalinibacter kiritimatiensis]|uniref:Uncharacterized protein n=1 Tax=Caldisalinibacter kiritimatiensis TaxID=1304284 RepID=R1CH04_9FIRM|nr:hypothetical protein [Caldisalinibacter kiritimatiensis]EOD01580.1 hypothetical protein L21TH_0319 [Caldisalinibacter kiritimatiensis]
MTVVETLLLGFISSIAAEIIWDILKQVFSSKPTPKSKYAFNT